MPGKSGKSACVQHPAENDMKAPSRSPLQTIRVFRAACQGDSLQGVTECGDTACALHPYRHGECLDTAEHESLAAIRAFCITCAGYDGVSGCVGDQAAAGPWSSVPVPFRGKSASSETAGKLILTCFPSNFAFVTAPLMPKKIPPQQVEFPLDRAFTFFESGPVLLIATHHKGKNNLMTLSRHAAMGFEPTLGLCLGPWNFSYTALKETEECVVAIPSADLLEQVVAIGNCSGETMDKFKEFALTPLPSLSVGPPLVAECLYNLECRIVNRQLAHSYNFFVLQGVRAWRNPSPADTRSFHAVGDGTFILDGELIDLRHKMTKWQHCI